MQYLLVFTCIYLYTCIIMYLLHIEGPLLPPRQVVLLLPAQAATFATGLECVHSNLFVYVP
jgi:hypothetical protein